MKIHRILGPLTVSFGLVQCAVGFHFARNDRGIIGFVVITVIMLVFVSSIVFFARRRKSRRQAYNTAAAQNFREGQGQEQAQGQGQYFPQYVGQEGVPLQQYGGGGGPPNGRPEPYSLPSYHSDGGYASHQPPRYA